MREIHAKCVVLGSRGVGKTSLVTKYNKNVFLKDIAPTIGAELMRCKVILNDNKVKLQIWDTAGQERFKAVAPMYYRNANAAILVFDLTQYRTFTELKSWIQELHRNVQDPMILTLVGNKLDLTQQRTVSRDEAFLFASSIGATYFETSAETDQGLSQVFNATALGLIRLADEGKCRTLRTCDSCDSIANVYTNNNTAISYTSAAAGQHLPAVHIGISVEGEEVKANAVGRLEMPSWSIEHIAVGEELESGWCCF